MTGNEQKVGKEKTPEREEEEEEKEEEEERKVERKNGRKEATPDLICVDVDKFLTWDASERRKLVVTHAAPRLRETQSQTKRPALRRHPCIDTNHQTWFSNKKNNKQKRKKKTKNKKQNTKQSGFLVATLRSQIKATLNAPLPRRISKQRVLDLWLASYEEKKKKNNKLR
jgi:hypothetical protein